MTREGIVWSYQPQGARFGVQLLIRLDRNYIYDGHDPIGETQAKIDSGDYVAFDSEVRVLLDGRVISRECLGGSVYDVERVADFWTAHRDSDPLNRNCTIMRGARGTRVHICHYFPDMVRLAIHHARQHVATMPKLRSATQR